MILKLKIICIIAAEKLIKFYFGINFAIFGQKAEI